MTRAGIIDVISTSLTQMTIMAALLRSAWRRDKAREHNLSQ